ncbi:AbrB/MazE/SpoVT family DNA-binding domain-containing protein [Pseudalkalibacillus caeni]|uniref:AbrB/MazE/SpoVT family DNA-binding domain-containing protein n=1 Tax=Exobacillus caeni TaxID=2574798 RepID=A0A5R9F992_9BACL|nr:AbrB/MazE/SpoVT family DNA-binding domain-containing protein [Pseudalkalibacillus caeni]TLS36275.1 AbrB/MazE/SpoVT family DNA-binding domain-containing protein [Pseudalkalibacillus caeni]
MKSTGIVRKIDELGRIVIPMELRKVLQIMQRDPVEIYLEEDRIVLKKHSSGSECQLTGEVSPDNIVLGDGKLVLSKGSAVTLVKEIEKNLLAKA